MKLIQLHVFRNQALGDCSNKGISSKVDDIYVIDPRGHEVKVMPPLDRVFTVEDRGEGYKALLPVQRPEGAVGPMFGGNLASALYGAGGAEVYRIHDRFETREAYREMSRD